MTEGPSPCVFLEGLVKQFIAHNRLSKDVKGSGGLCILFGTKFMNLLGVGHQWTMQGLVTLHVRNNLVGRTSAMRHGWIVLYLGAVLNKRVHTFVHPGHLPLITV